MNKVIICILIASGLILAQEPNVIWTKTYGTSIPEEIFSVRQTLDHGFIMAGYSGSGFNTKVYLVKVDGLGNIEWVSQPNYIGCRARSVELAVNDGYVVVGDKKTSTEARAFFMKFSPQGALQRYVEYPYAGGELNYIQRTRDGNYFVVGSYFDSYEANEVWAAKLNPLGDIIWWHRTDFPGPHYDDFGLAGWEAQYDPEPGYVITGKTSSAGDDYDIFIEKITPGGTSMWLTWFGTNHEDEGTSIKEVPDGYVVTGLYTTRPILVKRGFNGAPVWEKYLADPTIHFAEGFDLETLSDGSFIICGGIRETVTANSDVFVVKTDRNGNIQWSKTIGGVEHDGGYSIEALDDTYIIAGATLSFGAGSYDGYLIKISPIINDTDDPLAIAYNGNRHLAREPNTEKLHLVYTRMDSVIYQYSSNGGANWTTPLSIGRGGFPAIALSSDNLPSVTWTDEPGGLWYRRQTAPGVWGEVYRLYYPVSPLDPFVNSPPAITIIPSNPDEVHILITRTGRIQMNGVVHTVEDCIFPITNPEMLVFELIEQGVGGMYPPLRSHPSIARSPNNLLHAVWQRADTICYATRQTGQSWQNWGPRFGNQGIQSAHPFVETYGDMVYVVWEHKQTPVQPEDVWKGRRRIDVIPPQFTWDNISQTPNTPSRYPVNASGTFTVFQDSPWPPINGPEIYYTTDGELYNLSQTILGSFYPQSVSRFLGSRTYLYTAWLEGDAPAYEIRFKKIQYIPMEIAYLTSNNGFETLSPYLVARDSFIYTWQIPVDVGYQTITYKFPLEHGYRYKMKVIAYHESSGQWREWIKIDNKWKHLIKCNAYKPETLEFWVPPAFYEDGVIEVVFDRITGDFATAGPIYVYQYEYEEETTEMTSGPMAQEAQPLNRSSVILSPNPFTQTLKINFRNEKETFAKIKVYDASGRSVKTLYNGIINEGFQFTWSGKDESGRPVSQGIYFLTIENPDTKETICHKIIKVE